MKPLALLPDPRLLILAAGPSEMGAIEDRLERVVVHRGNRRKTRIGTLAGLRVVVGACPAHAEGALATIDTLVRAHEPELVLAVGHYTGLSKGLSAGSWVLPQTLLLATTSRELQLPTGGNPGKKFHPGRLVTAAPFPENWDGKLQVAQEFSSCDVLDRYAFFAADACRQLEVPFQTLGVVIESVVGEKPSDVMHFKKQKSIVGKAGAFIGGVSRRPKLAKDLWRQKESQWVAGSTLVQAVEQFSQWYGKSS